MSRVADLLEPHRVAFQETDNPEPHQRLVHYASSGEETTLCGHSPGLRSIYGTDFDAPAWVHDDAACAHCQRIAVGLLRWWHPPCRASRFDGASGFDGESVTMSEATLSVIPTQEIP